MPTLEDAPKTLSREQRGNAARLAKEYNHRVLVWWTSEGKFALTFAGQAAPEAAILVEEVGP